MSLSHLWQALKTHLSPQVLERALSSYNGDITVVEVAGNRRIMVDGYVQSGGFVDILWQKSIVKLQTTHKNWKPKHAAVFGFAGGSAGRVLAQLWPGITIDAVDIDPVIIELGKKYFHTDTIPNLTIHVQSVFEWIKTTHHSYDLIIIDLFKGGKIPQEAASEAFVSHLYQLLKPHSHILVNYFPHETNAKDLHHFDRLVRQIFPKVDVFDLLAEKMYILSNEADRPVLV